MKPGAIFINASCGTVVDTTPWLTLSRAVTSSAPPSTSSLVEPKPNDEEPSPKLRGLDNVILTSHTGGSTQEAQGEHRSGSGQQAGRYFDNGSTPRSTSWKSPLPGHKGSSRLLQFTATSPAS